MLDLEAGLVDLRPARRAARHARTSATSCTTSAGTPARRRCARGRRTRTSSAATCSCPACARRASTSSTSRTTRAQPEARQDDRGRGDRAQGRLQPPAHRPLRPRRDLRRPRSATPRATGRAASSCSTTTTSRSRAPWEDDRGPQELAYDFWWHLNYDTVITSEWGTPNMVEDGLVGELLLGNKYGHKLHVWDLEDAPPRAGDRPRRRAPDGARAAARRTTRARRTASSASSPRRPT